MEDGRPALGIAGEDVPSQPPGDEGAAKNPGNLEIAVARTSQYRNLAAHP